MSTVKCGYDAHHFKTPVMLVFSISKSLQCPVILKYISRLFSIICSNTNGHGSMGKPLPGIEAAIANVNGSSVELITEPGKQGLLVLKKGWPSMFRSYLHDEERYNSAEAIQHLINEIDQEVQAAVVFAEAAAWEPVDDLTRFVYSSHRQPARKTNA